MKTALIYILMIDDKPERAFKTLKNACLFAAIGYDRATRNHAKGLPIKRKNKKILSLPFNNTDKRGNLANFVKHKQPKEKTHYEPFDFST